MKREMGEKGAGTRSKERRVWAAGRDRKMNDMAVREGGKCVGEEERQV